VQIIATSSDIILPGPFIYFYGAEYCGKQWHYFTQLFKVINIAASSDIILPRPFKYFYNTEHCGE